MAPAPGSTLRRAPAPGASASGYALVRGCEWGVLIADVFSVPALLRPRRQRGLLLLRRLRPRPPQMEMPPVCKGDRARRRMGARSPSRLAAIKQRADSRRGRSVTLVLEGVAQSPLRTHGFSLITDRLFASVGVARAARW